MVVSVTTAQQFEPQPKSKVERLMNLVICLLSTRQYLSAEQIRGSVAGYESSKSDEAFNRMFERDKNELRDLGIPLETGRTSGWSAVDGYRINRDAYELPDIDLDRDEAAAVALAAALWDSPEMTANSQGALMKLRAAGVQLDAEAVDPIRPTPPRGLGSESVLGSVLAAINEGRPVRFDHRPGRAQPYVERTLEPWGVVTHGGRWYLVGHDRDRDAPRTFRLSRIGGAVRPFGDAGSVQVPADVNLRELVAAAVTRGDAGRPLATAKLWVAEGRGGGLRRMAKSDRAETRAGRPGTILEVAIWSMEAMTRQVLAGGPDVVVLEPKELRDNVVEALTAMAGGAR